LNESTPVVVSANTLWHRLVLGHCTSGITCRRN
jgi:hypothetical protein